MTFLFAIVAFLDVFLERFFFVEPLIADIAPVAFSFAGVSCRYMFLEVLLFVEPFAAVVTPVALGLLLLLALLVNRPDVKGHGHLLVAAELAEVALVLFRPQVNRLSVALQRPQAGKLPLAVLALHLVRNFDAVNPAVVPGQVSFTDEASLAFLAPEVALEVLVLVLQVRPQVGLFGELFGASRTLILSLSHVNHFDVLRQHPLGVELLVAGVAFEVLLVLVNSFQVDLQSLSRREQLLADAAFERLGGFHLQVGVGRSCCELHPCRFPVCLLGMLVID